MSQAAQQKGEKHSVATMVVQGQLSRFPVLQNRPEGSGVMRRACSCKGSPPTCPVHVLWEKYLVDIPAGTQPWQRVTPNQVLTWMRKTLHDLAVSATLPPCCCRVASRC